jgi:hypothetical protein
MSAGEIVKKTSEQFQVFQNKLKNIFENDNYCLLLNNIILSFPNHNGKIVSIVSLDEFSFMMKVYAPGTITCNTDRPAGKDSPFVESEILRILNEDFFELTPCIPKLFYVHKMSESAVKKNIKSIQECIVTQKDIETKKNCHEMCVIWDGLNSGLTTGQPTFILMEEGHIRFDDFCRNTSTHIDVWIVKSIIWMVIYTLKLITDKYPKFKHGDLYARNIILCVDEEFIEKDRLGKEIYIKMGEYFIPYVGIIPKIIDFELSILNDDIQSSYKLFKETDDINQLLYSIKSFFRKPNQITELVDNIIGIKTDNNLTFFQFNEIINKAGGIPDYETLLKSAAFNYKTDRIVEPKKIWGAW